MGDGTELEEKQIDLGKKGLVERERERERAHTKSTAPVALAADRHLPPDPLSVKSVTS